MWLKGDHYQTRLQTEQDFKINDAKQGQSLAIV